MNVWKYIDRRVETLRCDERTVTADNYLKAARCLMRYCQNQALSFEEITEDFVTGFNAYLQQSNNQKATISFYNRTLRAIYNQAAKDGFVKNIHPFDEVYTKVVPKLSEKNVGTVKSSTGEIIRLDSLSNDELVRRYKILQMRYNTLVNKLSAIVGA